MQDHNQTRMQRKNYSRQEKFLADEKNILQELPVTDFEVKYYKSLKVGHNNHIYLSNDKHHKTVIRTGKTCKKIPFIKVY